MARQALAGVTAGLSAAVLLFEPFAPPSALGQGLELLLLSPKTLVADVNFRTAGDAFGTLYMLGRARSREELSKATVRARDGDRVRKLVEYVEVRP